MGRRRANKFPTLAGSVGGRVPVLDVTGSGWMGGGAVESVITMGT